MHQIIQKNFKNMSIFGVGTDIVSVERIKRSLKNVNFLSRVFNSKEILKCKKKASSFNCYAKRFAAKEAFSKALGTGISNGIIFNEIIILNKKSGKPYITLSGQTKKVIDSKFKKKKIKILLSLSDETNYAVAFVTISL